VSSLKKSSAQASDASLFTPLRDAHFDKSVRLAKVQNTIRKVQEWIRSFGMEPLHPGILKNTPASFRKSLSAIRQGKALSAAKFDR
jgi:hypothetical protein